MLVSGAVIYNKGHGHDRYEASPRNPTPRVLYTFAPTLARASSQLDDSSHPAPPRNDDLTSQHGTSSPPGTSYSPWSWPFPPRGTWSGFFVISPSTGPTVGHTVQVVKVVTEAGDERPC